MNPPKTLPRSKGTTPDNDPLIIPRLLSHSTFPFCSLHSGSLHTGQIPVKTLVFLLHLNLELRRRKTRSHRSLPPPLPDPPLSVGVRPERRRPPEGWGVLQMTLPTVVTDEEKVFFHHVTPRDTSRGVAPVVRSDGWRHDGEDGCEQD